MGLRTSEIRDECDVIPIGIVTAWDFAVESHGTTGHVVKDVTPDTIEFCDGTVIDKNTVAWKFDQNPAHERERFANKA